MKHPRLLSLGVGDVCVQLFLILEEAVYESLGVEELQVFHSLAQSDVFHGHLQLVADADDHSALGRAVELGDGQ